MARSAFRDDLLEGKVVLVTGGGTGIGLGICRAFGRHGARVVMGGRREEVLREACDGLAKEGIEAAGFRCDVRDPASCEGLARSAAERFGRIDFLINNAAGNFSTPIENLTPNGFKTVMDIDLHGSFNMAKAVLPHLKSAGGGVIINISATLHYKAFPFQMHASAAKSAIDVMTNNIGVEWGEYGIRCVAIAPGPIEGTVGGPTGRVFGALVGQMGGSETDSVRLMVPIGRFGKVDDVANTALFVCSDAGSYINATSIVVDGGAWHGASHQYVLGKEMIAKVSSKERKTHKGGVAKL